MSNPFALPDTAPTAPAQPAAAPVMAPAPTPAPVAQAAPAADPFAGDDPFGAPAPQQPRGPRIRDLYGRLLLIVPKKLEENLPNRLQVGKFQDRLTADVIVLDGGPIAFGGKPEAVPPVPHDKTAPVPHKTVGQYISNVGLISQCRIALANKAAGTGPGMVLGRLGVGKAGEEGQNAPYILSPPTDAEKAIARAYLASVQPFA